MRFDRALDWSLILSGLFAVSLALGFGLGVGLLVPLGYLLGLATGIMFFLESRRLSGTERSATRTAALAIVLAVALAAIVSILATPLSFKGSPGTGVNQEPSELIGQLRDASLPLLLIVCTLAVALPWHRRLPEPFGMVALVGAAVGALALIITNFLPLPGPVTVGLVVHAVFLIAFGALAFAILRPWANDDVEI